MSWRHIYQSCDSGAAAVEAVFVFPLLIVLGFGAVDGSLLMLQNHKMENGLSAAGNYLSRAEDPQNYEASARRLATTGQLASGGSSKISGWSANDVIITYESTANPDNSNGRDYRGGNIIKVARLTSELTYDGIGFLKAVTGGSITVKASYEERLIGDIS